MSRHWRWWVCGLLLCASSINYMDRTALASVSRRVIDELPLTKANYGTVEQYFGYAFACGAVLFGLLVDRFSVRVMYPLVLLAWSAVGILTGFAGDEGWLGRVLATVWLPFQQMTGAGPAFGSLLLCRTLLGLFEAGHWPCAMQTTQRVLAPAERAMGNSLVQSGTSIGAIVTPLIVAAMLTPATGSWRKPFMVIGAVGMAWVVAWLWTMRGQQMPAPAATEASPWMQSALELLADRRFWLLVLVVSCINGTWTIYRVWLPLVLQDRAGVAFTEQQTLRQILPVFYVVTDIGCLLSGAVTLWLHRRGASVLNARRLAFTGCALLMLLSLAIPGLGRGEWHVPGLSAQQAAVGAMLLVGAGSLGTFPCYYAFTQELSRRHMGLVTGMLSFFAWVVPSSLQQPLGAHIDRTGSYDVAFQAGAWPAIIAALALWLFWPAPPVAADSQTGGPR